MPKYDIQDLPPIGSPLSGVADAKADNTANHGDYAQTWRWKLTRPSNTGLRITESAASTATGTPPLVQIDTVAASTAIPLLVKSRGTEVFRVSIGTNSLNQILAANGASNAPVYSFQSASTDGMWHNGNLNLTVGNNRLVFSPSGNFLVGITTTPTSLAFGIVFQDSGTVPTSNGACLVHSSTLGLVYRSSVTDEGAGQNNIIHNRTSNVTGAGTDYTLTGSSALLDFGTTDPSLTLPTAGTYLLVAQVKYVADALGAADVVKFKLRNTTDSADIGTERGITAGAASSEVMFTLTETVTVTAASKVVQVWGYNSTSARGTITSTQTTLHYIRLS